LGIFLKDPVANLDYSVDWAAGYLDGQTITSSQWSVEPAEAGGIMLSATLSGPTRTTATLTGGIPGHVYRISNQVTLSDQRADARALTVRVEAR
jgi:hypothetical protein